MLPTFDPADLPEDEAGVCKLLREAAFCEQEVWRNFPENASWAEAAQTFPGIVFAVRRTYLLDRVADFDRRHNADRKGPWFPVSLSGRRFWPLDPRPQDFDIGDIAHSLANIPRFNGHGLAFLSVAQHSVFVSKKVSSENALLGLLHDAPEAYLHDISSPVKALLGDVYRDMETTAFLAICEAFVCPCTLSGWSEVKEADRRALVSEHRVLFPGGYLPLSEPVRPYPDPIEPWSPEVARERFLERFRELRD